MPPVSMKKVDIIAALLLLPVCLYVLYESGRWPLLPDLGNPAWIPRGVAVCLLLAAGLLLVRALQGRSLTLPSRLTGADRARVLWVAVLTGGYVILLERLGFIATTAPFLFGFGLVLRERRWVRLLLFATVVPIAVYLLFDTALHVPLPRGWFR
ncbi:MAG: tripartite tricarboxylate transporter TctB family protein [candidate division NC10 bacterium]|nr:tripartite tricarboxylate transporter TctB family protein [candidate division NC10 bacterium]